MARKELDQIQMEGREQTWRLGTRGQAGKSLRSSKIKWWRSGVGPLILRLCLGKRNLCKKATAWVRKPRVSCPERRWKKGRIQPMFENGSNGHKPGLGGGWRIVVVTLGPGIVQHRKQN